MTLPPSALDLLEEDDEFEEFPQESWPVPGPKEAEQLWENDWEDDAKDEAFVIQLRTEVQKHLKEVEMK